jgi:hypothetical protein
LTRPPTAGPAGGCIGAPVWEVLPVLEVLPAVWLCPANIADSADSGIERPELAIELTLIGDTPGLKIDSTDW